MDEEEEDEEEEDDDDDYETDSDVDTADEGAKLIVFYMLIWFSD